MATVLDYFETDSLGIFKIDRELRAATKSGLIGVVVSGWVHLDFDANATHISCLIPDTENGAIAAVALAGHPEWVLDVLDDVSVTESGPGDDKTHSSDLKFTGRMFLYTEWEPTEEEISVLKNKGQGVGVDVRIRGPRYAAERTALSKPLAFIAHDSRDKDAVARPLANELGRLRCQVWFDEFSLNVGDPLREKIEQGLKESKRCVLVLSPHFLSNKGWTKAEFDSIYQREIVEGKNVMLPVWHEVEKKDIYEYSPRLVDKQGVPWSLGAKEVARRIKKAIDAS